jgi:hypothetical protein
LFLSTSHQHTFERASIRNMGSERHPLRQCGIYRN